MNGVKLTVILDDLNGALEGYVRSYGIAIIIEKDDKIILFDTGTKVPPLMEDIKRYGISPKEIDAVILSHNHYDHTDGLPGILKENNNVPVYIHKDWHKPASFKGFQVPKTNQVIIDEPREITEIVSGIYLTSSILSPDYGGVYEHACFIDAGNSYILLCGCCHPGLNAFLDERRALNLDLDNDLHLIGGMHGFKFSEKEAQNLDPLVKSVILFHCTMNGKVFKKQFGKKCSIGVVGKEYWF